MPQDSVHYLSSYQCVCIQCDLLTRFSIWTVLLIYTVAETWNGYRSQNKFYTSIRVVCIDVTTKRKSDGSLVVRIGDLTDVSSSLYHVTTWYIDFMLEHLQRV